MKTDPVLKFLTFVLVLTGFFILASASIGITTKRDLPSYYFVLRQLLTGGLVGFIALVTAAKIPYRNYRRWAMPIFLLGLLAASAVFVPGLGLVRNESMRWIAVGPFTFQPSEFLKLAYIIYIAALFAGKKNEIRTFYGGTWPFLLISGLAGIILLLQKDLGTLVVMALSGIFVFSIAGASWKQILSLVFIGAVLFGIFVAFEPYRVERVLVFLNPEYDPQGAGYQVRQSLIAIGSGGIFGRGFGMSHQKFQYLPEPVGDSIFAVAAEEFGFIGSSVLLGLFMVFAWRGFFVSSEAPEVFGRLLGSGIVILIVLQSFINIAALSGLAPLTGIPLLFVSQGGSALAISLAEVGILLNISKVRS